MRLLRAELLRARSRRSVLIVALAGLLLAIGLGAASAWQSRPYSAEETSRAENAATAQVERCKEQAEKHDDTTRRCEMRAHAWLYDRWRDPLDDQVVEEETVAASLSLTLVSGLLGALLIGGEFTSGSLSNLLLFEPRRTRIWLAKLSATGILALLWAALCIGGYVATLTALGRSWDPGAWPPNWIAAMIGLGVRSAIVIAVAAVIAAAVTLAVRSTLATLGVSIAYVLVVEGIARIAFTSTVAEYALSSQLLGVLYGSHRIEVSSGGQFVYEHVTLQDSALVLLGVCVAVAAVSLLTFRRRDVA
ncbi:MAG TPA: ABC transporter permease subunit [Nocardioidaceae bacterium]|nr:ABC transporter permease subunit [Nocardioidaceae bacterium]